MSKEAFNYLIDKEWDDNKQCTECLGVSESWHGHPLYMDEDTIGHKPGCQLAAALKSIGNNPLMIGSYVSDIHYESFINEQGMFGTRKKTEHGCTRFKEEAKRLSDFLDKAML